MSVSRIEDLPLLWRTVRHLPPGQLLHRVRLRALKAALARSPERFRSRWRHRIPSHPGWPESFEALDRTLLRGYPTPEDNAKGRFTFLAEMHDLGSPIDWDAASTSQLWRYHLHYFEWAWAFVTHPDREWAIDAFARLFRSWSERTTYGRWDAWSPYVVSVRSWVLCDLFEPLVRGTDLEAAYVEMIAEHAGFVCHNLELDVGGNHLLKNLKALVGLGVFLDDPALVDLNVERLDEQVEIQILIDGGHFERSPSYHVQVLGDLVDLAGLLRAAGSRVPDSIDANIASMRSWLTEMLGPDGSVPLFNDAEPVPTGRLDALGTAPEDAGQPLVVLEPSGYAVLRPGPRLHLLVDVGLPCPDALPAHAHADCLSFELHVDDRPVVVDTGTSTYAPGGRRAYERSTAAHSTIEIDGVDQTEVWGVFRAARLARPTLEIARVSADGTIVVAASHDGYERLSAPVRHRRTWSASNAAVRIVDELEGSGTHDLVWTLVLAPGIHPNRNDGGWDLGDTPLRITPPGAGSTVVPVEVAAGFGRLRSAYALRWSASVELPASFESSLDICDSATTRRHGTSLSAWAPACVQSWYEEHGRSRDIGGRELTR